MVHGLEREVWACTSEKASHLYQVKTVRNRRKSIEQVYSYVMDLPLHEGQIRALKWLAFGD